MALPFSVAQFYGIFSAYNQAMWPAQWVLNALAVVAVAAIVLRTPLADRIAAGILALFWLWTGLAYHAAFFTAINPLAWGFAALAVAGGLAFLWQGVLRGRLVFALAPGWRALTASALIAFALVVYPAWSVFAGHRYPELPTFGLPCPTTLFTIGLLALAVPPCPRSVLIAPLAWSLIGGGAAFLLDATQDIVLIAAAAVAVALMLRSEPPHADPDHARVTGLG